MSGSTTPVLGLYKPLVDGDDDAWGDYLNNNCDILDGIVLPLTGGQMRGPLITVMGGGGSNLGIGIGNNTTGLWNAGSGGTLVVQTGGVANTLFGPTANQIGLPTSMVSGAVFTLAADPVQPMQAATKRYVDNLLFPDAPSDGTSYTRTSAAWSNAPTFATTKIGSGSQNALTITPGASAAADITFTQSGNATFYFSKGGGGVQLNYSGGPYILGIGNSLTIRAGAPGNNVLFQNSNAGWLAMVLDGSSNNASPNYFRISNSAAAGTPSIASDGGGANVGLQLAPKGTGGVLFGSGTQNILTLTPGAAAANAVTFGTSGAGGINLSGTVTAVTRPVGTNDTTLATTAFVATSYLPLIGGTLTGNLNVVPAAGAAQLTVAAPAGQTTAISLQAPSGQFREIVGGSATAARWAVVLGDGAAETGSNAGANFAIQRFSDAGAYIDQPLSINRANGVTLIAPASGTNALLQLTGTGAASAQINMSRAAGQSAQIPAMSSGSLRWNLVIADGGAETGGNAGSNFSLLRYSDAGAYIDIPLNINRASGSTTLTSLIIGGSNQYVLSQDSASCYHQFSPNWYWAWNKSNGTLSWIANGLGAFSIDGSGNGSFAGTMNSAGWQYAGNAAFGCWYDGYRFLTNNVNADSSQNLTRSYMQNSAWWAAEAMFVAASQTSVSIYCNSSSFSVSWAASASDRALKRNIRPVQCDALARVRAVQVHDLDYVPRDLPDDWQPIFEHWDCSLIADEVEAVMPFAVIPAPPPLPERPDAKGYASLNTLHLVATLWRAVQQLADELQIMKAARA